MAKTTSQIIAENKIKLAEAAAIAASRDEIHQKQMEKLTAAKMAAAAAAPVIPENIPEIPLTDTAVSKKPKVEVPLGSAYLTGKQPEVSGSYAAGIQAQQQRTPEQQKIWEAERNTALTQKAMEDYEKRQQQAAEDRKIRDADLQEIQSWSDEDRALLDRYIMDRDQEFYNMLNPYTSSSIIPAVNPYDNPLVEKYGRQRVNELAESLRRQRNEQTTKDVEQTAQEIAGKNGWAAAGHSLLSIPVSAMGGISGTIGLVKDVTQRTGRYSTLDANNEGNLLNTYAGAVRGEVAQNIAGDEYSEEGKQVEEGGAVRQALSYGYQGIMGAADSIARALIGGQYGALGLAAAGSFTQTVSEASRQGATPQQAVTLGVGSAILETATEKIPLDEMFKAAKGGAKGVIPVLKEAFRQAGIEATTEELSLAGNLLLEAAVLREKSSYNQKIGELVANGASYQEAKEQTDREIFNEVLQTAAVSGFSGFFSGGGSATFGALRTDSAPEVSTQVQQEVAAEAVPAAPAVEPAQQAGPSMEQLLNGVQDMTPAPAPLTEAQQHFDNASAIANGMEPVQQEESTSVNTDPAEHTPQEQAVIAEGGQVKGTGAAERNFSGKAAYQELLYEGNVQPDREGDVRPMEVPKTDGDGKRVTEFAANAYGAEATTDEMASTIESLIQDGELGFNVRSNRESLDNAAAAIRKRGLAETRNQITRNVTKGKIRDGDIEQAILLYAKYAEKGDMDNASEMMVDLAQMANITGRNLQMFKLLRRMTVEGQVMTLDREVRRTVDRMVQSGQVKKGYEPSFDPELMDGYRKALEELRTAKTPEAQQAAKEKAKAAQDAIYAAEAAKMPATFKAKWDAWRYMSMLGNAKTQVRNIAGNVAFKPYKAVKDTMAALFEKALPKDQRTKALIQDPALMKWAKADAKTEDVRNALKYTAKLGDDVSDQKLAEQRQIFDNKALDHVRKFVEKLPQAGDLLFKNDYYARSLAGFLKARGYTAEQIQSGQVDAAVLTEARTYAVNEAMKATFNDSNAFSDAISSIGRGNNDNVWKKVLNVAAEGILPFRRTPANIVVRFAEYSPAGLAKGMWDMATHVRKGDMSAATAIDQISAGLTGTGMMALGYMMAAGMNGIKLTGSGTEEDEKRQGHQDYALEFSAGGQEYSYKIDWAAPANLPLFVGANIYQAIQDAGGDPDVSKLTAIIRGMGTAFEPMLALSCMSSLNDLVEGVRYAPEGEALYSIASDVATSYFTQGIPALARQAYQATQENKQMTFANDEDPTIRDLQKTAAKVPFLGAAVQTDKVNAWGETEQQGDWMDRTFNSFVNPGTIKTIDHSVVEEEINRLNEAQTESVSPPEAPKIVSYTDKQGNVHKDVRLTEEQYQTLAKTQGQTARKILDDMISSKDYAALTDDQKATAIKMAYSYSKETGEIAAVDNHLGYSESWMKGIKDREARTIIAKTVSSSLDDATGGLQEAWKNGWDVGTQADDLKWAYDTFSQLGKIAKDKVEQSLDGMTADYVEARSEGVSHEAFLDAAKLLEGIIPQAGKANPRDFQKAEAIAGIKGVSEADKTLLIKQQMSESQNENLDQMLDLGYSPEQYAGVLKIYRDIYDSDSKTKKEDFLKKLMDRYGMTRAQANAVYQIYK